MGNSLQDQLIKAGLADAKQARKARTGKNQKKNRKKGKQEKGPSESAQAARQALAQRAARDRELNQQGRAKADRKALLAQVKQLIEQHRLPREEADVGYYFEENRKIRKLFVTPSMREQLAAGRLTIVKLHGRYDVVPNEVADKIRARDASCVVCRKETEPQPSEDDPYADYKVPDDLMW